MKKSKILYFSGYDYKKSSFIRQDVEAIAKSFNVKYISYVGGELNDNLGENSKIIEFPDRSMKSRIRWKLEKKGLIFKWKEASYGKVLKQAINEFQPDIIHCQFAYESAKLIHNFETDIPIVINFRGYGASYKLFNRFYVKWLNKTLAKKNIHSIFVSKSLKENLVKKEIVFKNKPNILYTGVDTIKFKRTTYPKSKDLIFIQVGNFNDKKGQKITIKAFDLFIQNTKDTSSKLIFIGSGKNIEECKNLTNKISLNQRIEFKGEMSQENIVKEMEKAHVFVHHSLTPSNGDQEGIPNSIIEAMAMELPVLSTFHSGIPEAVEDGVNGMLCKENDINTYSRQMEKVRSWKHLEINRNKVIEKFNISNHITELKNIYGKLLTKQ